MPFSSSFQPTVQNPWDVEYVEFPSTGGCFLWDVEKVNVIEETIRNGRISTATSATNLAVA